MTTAELPPDGECQLAAVRLPAGRRITPDGWHLPSGIGPVAWVTATDVADPGRVWSTLLEMHPQTGLVPLLIDADPGGDLDYYFYDPVDPRRIDTVSAASVLAENWSDPDLDEEWWPPTGPPDESGDEGGAPFPGLAPPVQERLSSGTLAAALAAVPPCRVALVLAARPADVLAVTGWTGTGAFQDPVFGVPVGAVLRSWEERFGARLLRIGPGADVTLLVERPPQTPEAARAVANEHWALADEFNGEGRTDIDSLASAITGAPLWQFWWD
jgi:hypothetical protein